MTNSYVAITEAVPTASSVKYSGVTVAEILSTVSAVDIWTFTNTVMADFDFEMTLAAVMAPTSRPPALIFSPLNNCASS